MAKDIRELFETDLKKMSMREKVQRFGENLFSHISWSFIKGKSDDSELSLSPVDSEKSQILYSMKSLIDNTEEKKISVDGGEIAIVKNSSSCRVIFVSDFSSSLDGEDYFVGESGDLLKKMIAAMRFNEGEYKLFHLTKDSESEKSNLSEIYQHIRSLAPEFVVTFGGFATSILLGNDDKLSAIHGQFIDKRLDDFSFKLVPLFHYENLLVNPSMKKTTWLDMQKVMRTLGKI